MTLLVATGDRRMNMDQWWNDTDGGWLKHAKKRVVMPLCERQILSAVCGGDFGLNCKYRVVNCVNNLF